MRQPLFILCPGRSFSSVVCAVIGQHPQAFGLPEVHLFVYRTVKEILDYDMPVFGRPGASRGLKRAVAELAFGKQTWESIEQASQWLAERHDKTGGAVFRELMELAGDRMLVDKSPTNSRPEAIRAIYAAFPDAKFLHLARHPRATCRSEFKAQTARGNSRKRTSHDVEAYWLDRHRAILEFATLLAPGQYMFLHGEELFADPKTYLAQICDWLDLPSDAAAIARMMKPELSPFACFGPDNAKLGNNRGFIESPHLRIGRPAAETMDGPLEWAEDPLARLGDETRGLANQLGYDN